MSLLGRMAKRFRAGAARSRLERDMQEEMQAHIEQAAERFRARGLSDADALVAARREFGNVGVLQEEARDVRGARWIESATGDLRHAMGQFARTPLLTVTIVLTLTLGIGVSSAGFGFLSAVLKRPAPAVPADPDLVTIRGIRAADGRLSRRDASYPELMDYGALRQFREVAGWTSSASMVVIKRAGHEAGSAFVTYVTPNFFRMLGLEVKPGNSFLQREFSDHSVPELNAVIAHNHAIAEFGTPEAAVGQAVELNGVRVQIIGVGPPRFRGPFGNNRDRAFWMPVSARPLIEQLQGDVFSNRTDEFYEIGARLSPGVSREQADAAVAVVASRAALARPNPISGARRTDTFTADVVPLLASARFSPTGDTEAVLMIIVGVILVLLVCTTTVSSLLVGAAVTRRQEIAIRLALGASRRRIIRQLLTENAVLAAVGGAAGLLAFTLLARALRDSLGEMNLDPSWVTVAATAVFSLVTAILCGLSPALHATRDALSGVLKDSSANATVRSRLQRTFVAAQIALTQPLLVGLAFVIAFLIRETDKGANAQIAEYVVRAEFDVWSAASRSEEAMPRVVTRIAALPGVAGVIPQATGYALFKLQILPNGARPTRTFAIRTHDVPPEYFRQMEIPLVAGRAFVPQDLVTPANRPIIIATDFAKRAFGDENPVGKRLPVLSYQGERKVGEAEVIGVVAAEDVGHSDGGVTNRVFTPLVAPPGQPMKYDALLVRTERPAEALIPTLREIARSEAPMMPMFSIRTLAQIERDGRAEVVQAAGASAIGGIITLLLAAVGLYAVVALSVTQRRREIGVRVSLGARPGQVVAHFFGGGLRVSLLGLVIGLPLSIGALKLLGSQAGFYGAELAVIAGLVALTVVTVASLASWLPARRAAGVDPLRALRDG